jgi:hypothetical protein
VGRNKSCKFWCSGWTVLSCRYANHWKLMWLSCKKRRRMDVSSKRGRFWRVEPEYLRPDEAFSSNIRVDLQFENAAVYVILLGYTSTNAEDCYSDYVYRSKLFQCVSPCGSKISGPSVGWITDYFGWKYGCTQFLHTNTGKSIPRIAQWLPCSQIRICSLFITFQSHLTCIRFAVETVSSNYTRNVRYFKVILGPST